jgi:glycosyltransferase involved in cell wall biosynthesis
LTSARAHRVLIAIHDLGAGGAERVATGLAGHLGVAGVRVAVLTIGGGDDFYPLDARVERLRLDGSVPAGGPVAANLVRVARLRASIRAFRPTAIASFMTTTNVLVLLATRGLRAPVVVSERTWPPAMPLGGAWHRLRRATYRYADRVVVLTERTRDWVMLELGIGAERVAVIPNPVHLPLPDHSPRLEPPGDPFVLAVGRLGPEKDFAALIEASARMPRAVPVVIVGEGGERDRLTTLARERGVDLRLPGRVGNLASWYRAARCLVLTSRFEGFPNVLIEAMSHGCPVVSVDCEVGPREIVRDGVDGLLVAPDDGAALAAALARLVDDDALRDRLARAAPEVAERFSAAWVYGAWADLLGVTPVAAAKR